MSDQFSYDPNLAGQLNGELSISTGNQLPFPAIYLWPVNGKRAYKQNGDFRYFGGWTTNAENLPSTADPLPWPQVEMDAERSGGGSFQAYGSRVIHVAYIDRRSRWIIKPEGDTRETVVAPGTRGARQHLQVLGLMAVMSPEKALEYWGPVVLTMKGFQGRHVQECFSRWNLHTLALRKKLATPPGGNYDPKRLLPANCFYLSLGTFGDQPNITQVGPTGRQSPITPMTPLLPENMTLESLQKRFVGNEVATLLLEYKQQAQEWLTAWAELGTQDPGPSQDEPGTARLNVRGMGRMGDDNFPEFADDPLLGNGAEDDYPF